MPASPRRRHSNTRVVWLIALICACKSERPRRHAPVETPSSSEASAPKPPAPDAGATVDAAAGNHITLSFEKPKLAGSGLAKRCTLAGDPIANDCSGRGGSVAFDRAGTLYVVAGAEVRRYRRAASADEPRACRFESAGPAIALPEVPVRAQRIDGPVYMRSGGPAWQLAAAGDAVYTFDYLGGLYRIDRGKSEPACVDEFGYRSITSLGGKVVVGRNGIEKLALGRKCRASSAHIDDKARGEVQAIRDHLYVTTTDTIVRYDGTTRVALAEGTRLCGIVALASCGDGVCAVDNNCMQVVQVAADGTARTIDGGTLFDSRPFSLQAAAAARDGGVVVLATQRDRDRTSGRDVCEATLYELPAALFER